jgi:hypothetical protein
MLLLPALEQKPIYDQIDFSRPTGLAAHTSGCTAPGSSAWQLPATDVEIDVFRCPSDPPFDTPAATTPTTGVYARNRAHRVSYGFVTAHYEQEGTGMPYRVSYRAVTASTKSAWWHNGAALMADFLDGTSNTILMIETPMRKTSTSFGPYWSHYTHTMYIVPKVRNPGINKPEPGDALNRQYAWAAGSKHPGGAQAVMGDDVVKFLSENIDLKLLLGAISVAGGEVLGKF